MKLLLASDLHCDGDACKRLVDRAGQMGAVVIAGDLAIAHEGLAETVSAISSITTPTVLVPGNNETHEALVEACEGWQAATVLHGESCDLGGVRFFGLGCAVPPIEPEWSFDLEEDQAASLLAACPENVDVLITHSPPRGHADEMEGEHIGSEAVLEAIRSKRPRLVVCGHVHDCWGMESMIDGASVMNVGPDGRVVDI